MKKTLYILLAGLTLSFAACTEEEEDPTPNGPTYTELNLYTANLLGGQTNATLGSFYSTSEDSIYFTSRATEKQSKVDLIYYFGSQTGDSSVIAGPSDVVFTNPDDQNPHKVIKTWTVKNDTRFKRLNINISQFNAMLNDSLLINELDSGMTATKITKLELGEVVGFKTAEGKLGSFVVTNIENTSAITRAITINVKVQK